MCGGGGGGDPMAYERERQAKIQATIDKINAVFENGGRGIPPDFGTTSLAPLASGSQQIGPLGALINPIIGQVGGTKITTADQARTKLGELEKQIAAAEQAARSQGGASGGGLSSLLGSAIGSNATPSYSSPELDSLRKQYDSLAGQLADYDRRYAEWDAGAPGVTRDQLYDEHRGNVLALNSRELDRQRTEAERQLRFSLARAGLAGGSTDVDANAELKRRYDEGLLQVSGLADKAAEGLRTSDERTRLNVISQAQSGLDSTSATQAALRQLEGNQQAAFAENQAATLGDLFAGISDAYGRGRFIQGQSGVLPQPGTSTTQNSSGLPSNPGRTYQGS